ERSPSLICSRARRPGDCVCSATEPGPRVTVTATDTEHSGPPPSLSRTGGAAPPRAARAPRLLPLAAGGVSMLAGLNAALLLLGLPAPLEHTSGPGLH